jgi:hypothetical protein
MLKRSRIIAVGGALAAALAVAAPSGSAQAPGTTTLSLFEPANGGSFRIIDNAPRSPVKNPESKKYRFSVGDELIFSNPVLDKKGGSRLATLYVKATVVHGKTFTTVKTISQVVLEFNDGSQINAAGAFSFAKDVRIAITGGTGTYLGARGEVVSKSNPDDSSQDTITLLP